MNYEFRIILVFNCVFNCFIDNIAVLNNGKFVEVGAYEHLMTIENGMFRKLVEKQTIQQ